MLGSEHPATLTTVSTLPCILARQGKFAEAEPLERELLAARKRLLGDAHPDTLKPASNLAITLAARGEGPWRRRGPTAAMAAGMALLRQKWRGFGPMAKMVTLTKLVWATQWRT